MSSTYEFVLNVLHRHVSRINAQLAVGRALSEAQLSTERFTQADLPKVLPHLEKRLRLFTSPDQATSIIQALGGDEGSLAAPEEQRFDIKAEEDIVVARVAARDMCTALQARRSAVQKVATIVSELARNIFMYSAGGAVTLTPQTSPARVTICALDEGPGIPNLNEILEGRYESRTGLGAGIVGTKRLADRFDIQSEPKGTRVEAEVRL